MWQAPLKIGSQHVSVSITILEDDSMPFLFGLDMLRRYQCSIDLHKNVLRFGSINDAELPFLAEHELPERLRHKNSDVAGGGVGEGAAPGPAALPNSTPGHTSTIIVSDSSPFLACPAHKPDSALPCMYVCDNCCLGCQGLRVLQEAL